MEVALIMIELEKVTPGVANSPNEPLCTHLHCTFYPLNRSDMEGGVCL